MKRQVSALVLAVLLGACAAPPTPVATPDGGGDAAAGAHPDQAPSEGETAGGSEAALLGTRLDRSLGRDDLAYAQRFGERALEYAPAGQPVAWSNPATGSSGTYVPQRAYQDQSGQYCRAFLETVTVGGRTQQGDGTACRRPDGSWQAVD